MKNISLEIAPLFGKTQLFEKCFFDFFFELIIVLLT